MPVTDVSHDLDTLTISFTAQFAAPVEKVWDVYTNPRQLEKWFGPPGYPSTFVSHDLTVGGRATYYMTSPEGDKLGGWWQFTAVEPTSMIAFDDGFGDAEGNPTPGAPTSHNEYRFSGEGGTTTVVTTSRYDSAEAMQTVLDMGVIEGATMSINQIDAVLAEG